MDVNHVRSPFNPKYPIHNNKLFSMNVWHRGIVAEDHFDDSKVQFKIIIQLQNWMSRAEILAFTLKKCNNQPMHSNLLGNAGMHSLFDLREHGPCKIICLQ